MNQNNRLRDRTRVSSRIYYILLGLALLAAQIALGTGCSSRVSPIPVETQRGVAMHEAGHAGVALALNPDYPLDYIKVWTVTPAGNSIRGGMGYRGAPDVSTPQARFNEAVVRMAGAAAERIVLGREPQGDPDDLAKAQAFCRPICPKRNGVCPDIVTDADGNPKKSQAELCLADAQNKAEAIVQANANRIKDLADTLMNSAPQYGYRWVSAGMIRDCLLRDRH